MSLFMSCRYDGFIVGDQIMSTGGVFWTPGMIWSAIGHGTLGGIDKERLSARNMVMDHL